MSLVDHVIQLRDQHAPDSVDRCILSFLIEKAVGRANAKTWGEIDAHLQQQGHSSVRQQTFQQGVLKDSREGESFIGSTDKQPDAGYFLIADRRDAEVVSDFIIRRLTTQQNRLQHLRDLVNRTFP